MPEVATPSQVDPELPVVVPGETQEPAAATASEPETEPTTQQVQEPSGASAKPAAAPAKEPEPDHQQTLRAREQEIAPLKRTNAEAQLRAAIADMQAKEERDLQKDRQDVAEGTISQAEATQRATTRQQHRELQWQTQMQQQQLGVLTQQAGKVAYIQAAHIIAGEVGKEEGLSETEVASLTKDLLTGDRLPNPQAMEAKALRIMNKRLRDAVRKASVKPETFVKGPGSTGARMSDDAFLKAFNAGDLNSPADFKRAKAVLDKLT